MSFLDRIAESNRFDPSHFRPWYVGDMLAGWMKPTLVKALKSWPEVFVVSDEQVRLHPRLEGFEQRTQALAQVNRALVDAGVIDHLHGELYPIKSAFHVKPLLLIDRACAPYFGIRAWGQHLNGYVRRDGEIWMWIGKRSEQKRTFPGKLDNLVAGGLPHGLGLKENLIKECREEASIPPALCERIVSTGAISYCVETPQGLKPDVMFCYDLELPESFTPICQDGEVAEFFLWPLQKVADIVRDTTDFKRNCNLTIIDFLLRHGFLKSDHPDYLALFTGLRQVGMAEKSTAAG